MEDQHDENDVPPSLQAKREFMKLPMEERRRILRMQAERAAEHEAADEAQDDEIIGGGDFFEE